jgi:hypothetical protein
MMEIVQMTPQEDTDSLPTHPLLGYWRLCGCGHKACRRVYPSKIGSFYEGSGFEMDEARKLVAALKPPRNAVKPAICCVCGKDLKARVPVDAEKIRCFTCTEAGAQP